MAKMATFGQRWPRLQSQLDDRSYDYIRWITTFFTRPSVVRFANLADCGDWPSITNDIVPFALICWRSWHGISKKVFITQATHQRSELRNLVEARRHWQSAQRWKRLVDKELSKLSLNFVQWHTLEVLSTLINETNDAVSQNDVVRRSELDRTTISKTMSVLDNLGLISREPGFQYLAYRIWLSDKGVCTLENARRVLLDVPSPADVTLLD